MIEQKIIILLAPFVFLQLLFTPGIIFLYKFKLNLNFFSIILLSLASSFFINYFLVFILLIFGLYNFISAWLLIILLNIYFFLKLNEIKFYLLNSLKISNQKFFEIIKNDKFLSYICIFISLLLAGLFIQNFSSEIKSLNYGYLRIFENQDSVQMYDMWAKEYARGNFPATTFLRPHLISINISLIYVLFNSIFFEFVALFIFSLFSLYFILVGLSLSLLKRSILFLPISIFAVNILFNNTFGQAFSGYLEVPMSLFFMIFIISLYEFSNSNTDDNKKLVLVYISFLTTFLIKEWVWLNLLFIALYFLFSRKFFNKNIDFKLKIFFVLFNLILIYPFYIFQISNYYLIDNIIFIFKQLTFDKDLHTIAKSNPLVLDWNTRLIHAFNTFPSILITPCILVFIFNFKDKILNLFILSYFAQIIFWFLFAANEFRYLYFQFFFFILFGYYNFLNFLIPIIYKFQSKISFNQFLVFLFSAWILFISLYNKTLSKKEIEFKVFEKKVTLNFNKNLDKQINNFFYNYFLNKKNLQNKILSNYRYFYVKNIPIFNDVFEYQKNINLKNLSQNKFSYFLIYKNCKAISYDNIIIIKLFNENTCFIKRISP